MVLPVSDDLGVPRMLFQAGGMADYEVAPDGTRFLAHLQERSNDPPLHLLVNWLARLGAQR